MYVCIFNVRIEYVYLCYFVDHVTMVHTGIVNLFGSHMQQVSCNHQRQQCKNVIY